MSEYFTEPKSSRGRMKVELDLSNHTTKTELFHHFTTQNLKKSILKI